jgi:hypothetical protein
MPASRAEASRPASAQATCQVGLRAAAAAPNLPAPLLQQHPTAGTRRRRRRRRAALLAPLDAGRALARDDQARRHLGGQAQAQPGAPPGPRAARAPPAAPRLPAAAACLSGAARTGSCRQLPRPPGGERRLSAGRPLPPRAALQVRGVKKMSGRNNSGRITCRRARPPARPPTCAPSACSPACLQPLAPTACLQPLAAGLSRHLPCARPPRPAPRPPAPPTPTPHTPPRRHRGGGLKRKLRQVDFRRRPGALPAVVERLEYDPGRTAYLALLKTPNPEVPSQPRWSYMLAPQQLQPGGRRGLAAVLGADLALALALPLPLLAAAGAAGCRCSGERCGCSSPSVRRPPAAHPSLLHLTHPNPPPAQPAERRRPGGVWAGRARQAGQHAAAARHAARHLHLQHRDDARPGRRAVPRGGLRRAAARQEGPPRAGARARCVLGVLGALGSGAWGALAWGLVGSELADADLCPRLPARLPTCRCACRRARCASSA